MADAKDDWIWTRYWQADRVASCSDGVTLENYGDSLAAGWRDFFDSLPQGARILDLCTGNGAVPLIALESGGKDMRGFAIAAVDQADIDPAVYVSGHSDALASIRFVPGVRAEALPFADAAFDAVTSQYGIEYSDLGRSLGEAVRVLAPRGKLHMVLHAAQGVVCASAKRAIADADLLLDKLDLPGAAARCIEAVTAVERAPDATEDEMKSADALFAAFQAAIGGAIDHIPSAGDVAMVRDTAAILFDTYKMRQFFAVEDLLAKVEEARVEIVAHKGRLQAMVAAAVDTSGQEAISGRLSALGMDDIVWGIVEDSGGGLVGYVVEACRPRPNGDMASK